MSISSNDNAYLEKFWFLNQLAAAPLSTILFHTFSTNLGTTGHVMRFHFLQVIPILSVAFLAK